MLALDHAFIPRRRLDSDGRMRVAGAALSRTGVFEYAAADIPGGGQELSLAADEVVRVHRSASELAKAAPSFAGAPVLARHVARDAPFDPRLVVGTVGSDVTFDGEFLRATVTVWDRDAIGKIRDGSQCELSAGYCFSVPPVMRAGTFRGQAFDCMQSDLICHHIAIVDEGKCGRACAL
jgi:hypothetical protein